MAKRSGVALTKRVVDAAEKTDRRYHVWDEDLSGFALRVEPTGVKTFVIKYRAEGGVDPPSSAGWSSGASGHLPPIRPARSRRPNSAASPPARTQRVNYRPSGAR